MKTKSILAAAILVVCSFLVRAGEPIPIASVTGPVGIVVATNNNHVYVLDSVPYQFSTYGSVKIFDGATNAFIRSFATGQFSHGITFDGYRNKVYVAGGDDAVWIINSNTDQLVLDQFNNPKKIKIPSGSGLASIAFSYYSTYTYVTYFDGSLSKNSPAVGIIDGATDSVVGSIYGFDGNLTGITWPLHFAAHLMYALRGGAPGKVYAIDSLTNTITKTITVGNSSPFPFETFVSMGSENSRTLTYVANSDSNTVSVIDRSETVVATIPVPSRPVAVAGEVEFAAGGGHVWVACKDAGTVVEIEEHRITRTWTGFNKPTALLFNRRDNKLYVGCAGQLYVIHL